MTKFAAFGTYIQIGDGAPGAVSKTITAATAAANVATFTTSVAHLIVPGDKFRVTGVTPSAYNGDWYAITAAGSTITADIGSTPAAGSVFGSLIKLDSFTTIAQVRDIQGLTLAADTIDVTTHDSAGAWREFVAGEIDTGELSLDLVWDPDSLTQQAPRDDLVSRIIRSFKVTFPDLTATEWDFSGIVTAFEIGAPADGELSASVTIKGTSQPTLA